MFFNLLPHGTAEGRLASSARRRGIDLNAQNIPKSMRVLFVPDSPEMCFVECDYVQGENFLTAWLAQDTQRLGRLRTPGYDEHSDLASRFFGKAVSKTENATLRKPGKIMNHGKNYGAGVKKIQEQLALEGFYYSLGEVKEMDLEWRRMNPGTARWQQQVIQIAAGQSHLVNAFGRKRWFQNQRDYATKALAFLPASTLADIVLRVMIGLHPDRFAKEIGALGIRVVGALPEGWRLMLQVHDSLLAMGPTVLWQEAARVMRLVMTQAWAELQGFGLDVETAMSERSWGEVVPVEPQGIATVEWARLGGAA